MQERYAYDGLGQLIREDSRTQNKTITYTYDNGGNLTEKKEYPYSIGGTESLGEPQQTFSYTYGDDNWKDKLTAYQNETITYDAIGNPLNWKGRTLTWQHGRQLQRQEEDGLVIEYEYNDAGIRTRKTVNGQETRFYLNGSAILSQVTGNEQIDFLYDDAGALLGFKYGDAIYYYIQNLQGDIIGILDSTGNQIVSYSYSAWGEPVSTTGSAANTIGVKNPFRYRGYYYDLETGFYYATSRYCDPEIGRWINADGVISDIGGDVRGCNVYAYCFNNPVNMADSSGTWPSWSQIFTGIAIAAVVVAAVAVTVATCGLAVTALAVAGGGVAGGITAGVVATATAVATGAIVVAGVSATAAVVRDVVEHADYRGRTRSQTVYKLVDDKAETKYVGRTNNPTRRAQQHRRSNDKKDLNMVIIASNLTKTEARAMEQIIISSYTLDNLINARREIAVGNVKGFTGKIKNVISIFGGVIEDEFLNLMGR